MTQTFRFKTMIFMAGIRKLGMAYNFSSDATDIEEHYGHINEIYPDAIIEKESTVNVPDTDGESLGL